MMWLIFSWSWMLLARLPVKLDCARAVKKIITSVKEVKRPTEPGLHDTFEPCHEKTRFLHMRKQSRRSDYAADQRLCFCNIDSTIPLLPQSEISSL